jgi:cation diffusion facilitator family transporter
VQENQNKKSKWIRLSFGVSFLLMLIKFWAFYLTNSNAILSDALESIINVIASGFAFYSIYLSSLPRDPNHPYGHGKIEYFSSGFEGALIIMAGVLIVLSAIDRLLEPQPITHLDWGSALIAITILVNFGLGHYLQKIGKSTRSEALIADGKHLVVDSVSSVIILVGLLFVYLTNIAWLDAAVSLLVSVLIFYNGFRIIRRSVAALMDEIDSELLNDVISIIKNHKKHEWIDVHNLRIQKYGSDLHIDCHLTLPYYWNLRQVHDSVHDFEEIVEKNTTGRLEVFIHADPCLPECCHYCKLNCTKRSESFKNDIDWDVTKLTTNQKHFVEV